MSPVPDGIIPGRNKEIDEIKEKIDLAIYSEITPISSIGGTQLVEAIRRIRNEFLSVATPTHRIAIVKKKAELPAPLGNIGRLAQQDMLDTGFVQEEK